MSTYVEMQARIADDLNRTDLTSQIKEAINRGIEHFAKLYNFWFMETTGTFSTVAGQFNYSSSDGIPTDIEDILLVEITIATNQVQELIPRTYNYIKTSSENRATTGTPRDYAYYMSNFWLYEIANAVYPITVSYRKKYTALSADADTNDFTVYAEDLIENFAEWWLYSRVIKDVDSATVANQNMNIALLALQTESERLQKSGRVIPTQF